MHSMVRVQLLRACLGPLSQTLGATETPLRSSTCSKDNTKSISPYNTRGAHSHNPLRAGHLWCEDCPRARFIFSRSFTVFLSLSAGVPTMCPCHMSTRQLYINTRRILCSPTLPTYEQPSGRAPGDAGEGPSVSSLRQHPLSVCARTGKAWPASWPVGEWSPSL